MPARRRKVTTVNRLIVVLDTADVVTPASGGPTRSGFRSRGRHGPRGRRGREPDRQHGEAAQPADSGPVGRAPLGDLRDPEDCPSSIYYLSSSQLDAEAP